MTLQEYLAARDIRPSVFAAEIGVAPSTISRILSGERSPGLSLLRLIHDKTQGEVTPNDFLGQSFPQDADRVSTAGPDACEASGPALSVEAAE